MLKTKWINKTFYSWLMTAGLYRNYVLTHLILPKETVTIT